MRPQANVERLQRLLVVLGSPLAEKESTLTVRLDRPGGRFPTGCRAATGSSSAP